MESEPYRRDLVRRKPAAAPGFEPRIRHGVEMGAAHDGHDGLAGVRIRGPEDARFVDEIVLEQR